MSVLLLIGSAEMMGCQKPSGFSIIFIMCVCVGPPSQLLIGYSPATVHANLIIRGQKWGNKNEIVMKYVMFWSQSVFAPQIIT